MFELAEKIGTTPERLIPSYDDELTISPTPEDLQVIIENLKSGDFEKEYKLDDILNNNYIRVEYKIEKDDEVLPSTSIELMADGLDGNTDFLVQNLKSRIQERSFLPFRYASNVKNSNTLVIIEIDDAVIIGYYNYDFEQDVLILIPYGDINGEKRVFDNAHKIRLIGRCLDSSRRGN